MAELSTEHRRAIEIWTGPLTAEDDLAMAISRLATLENPTVVAWEFLRIRYAALLAQPDELRIEGDARVRWVESKKQMERQLRECVEAIANSGANLNSAASNLMASALASMGGRAIRVTHYVSPNPRP